MDKPIRVTVPVVHSGEPVGVKTEGGFVDFVTREVEVECLPRDIPESLGIDIAELHINQSFKAGAMTVPAGVKVLTDPNTVLVLVSLPHKEEEAFPGEKPEGEVAAEEPKEPEVIKKERAEKGEEEGAEKKKEKEK
jgi:large subunit ribosomal protein L25